MKNEPAFPIGSGDMRDPCGMTLRDYFAIHIDQPGMLEIVTAAGLVWSDNRVWSSPEGPGEYFDNWFGGLPAAERAALYAKVRYELADAMLKERAK